MIMVRVAGQLRASYKKGDLPYAPSVGDLINWATLTADGLEVQKAAEETIVSTTSDEMATQEVVRRIIRAAASPAYNTPAQGAESLV
jgi:nitric oxide reductase NorQ protein